MAIDLEDIGFFRPEIYDLDPGKSRGRFDYASFSCYSSRLPECRDEVVRIVALGLA